VERLGPQHQAGSDSLLTGATFFKMREVCVLHSHYQGSYRSGKTGKSQWIWVVRERSGENIFWKSQGKWKIGATRCQIFRL